MSNLEMSSSPASLLLDPVLEVRLYLDPKIHAALEEPRATATIENFIEVALENLCAGFGIPGRVGFRIAPAADRAPDQDRFFRLEIGSRITRYSTVLLQNLRHLLDPGEADTTEERSLTQWLSAASHDLAKRYLQLVCLHVTSENAALLLCSAQFERYRADLLDSGVSQAQLAGAADVLRDVLDLGISIRERATIKEAFTRASGDVVSVRENLIGHLITNTIQICMPAQYLEELTSSSFDWAEEFKKLGESILFPTGVQRCAFVFVIDEAMDPRSFRFKVNDRYTPPLIGLGPEECLVNEIPGRLRSRGLYARAASHPATGVRYAISDLAHRSELDMEGKTVWDARAYLVLCVAELLARKAYCLISQERASALLKSLDVQYPCIAGYVRDLVPIETITFILRELVAERISIKNSRILFECIAEAGADPDPLARVRVGMARELTQQVARPYGIPVVYLLDKTIVDVLASEPPLSVDMEERVLAAIHGEMRLLPAGASSPCLVAPANLRRRLRVLIREEFPNTPVVTYAELARDVSVQPVARIS